MVEGLNLTLDTAPAAIETSYLAYDDTLMARSRAHARTNNETDTGSSVPSIGRYTYLENLGQGAMGVVIAAYDPVLDRKIAIKVIKNSVHQSELMRLRMTREAKAMARLSHPNVVTIYETGEFDGQLFVAMEYVKGNDLRGWLRGPLSGNDWQELLDLMLQAGCGLQAAHSEGLVHRDFKPDNIFVGADGRVRVGDFGLVRYDHGGGKAEVGSIERVGSALNGHLTRTGAAMGTPAYMPPEQFSGQQVDARADQFAFCVTTWEVLFGQRPFHGATFAELMLNTMEGKLEPPASSGVPNWVTDALKRGLSTDPEDRWPSMQALLDRLQEDPVASRRKSLQRVLLIFVVALIVGTFALAARSAWKQADRARSAELISIEERDRAFSELERESRQVKQEVRRTRDTLRMAVLERYKNIPTTAAAILTDVEDPASVPGWRVAASRVLDEPLAEKIGPYSWSNDQIHLTPDRMLVSLDDDAIASIRNPLGPNPETYSRSLSLQPDESATDLIVSPDGHWAAVILAANEIKSRRERTIVFPITHSGEFGPPRQLIGEGHPRIFSRDSTLLIGISQSGRELYVWTLSNLQQTILKNSSPATQVCSLSKDLMVTGHRDGAIQLREADTGQPILTYTGLSKYVTDLRCNKAHSTIAALERDSTALTVWKQDAEQPRDTLQHTRNPVEVKILPDGKVLTVEDDGAINSWSQKGELKVHIPGSGRSFYHDNESQVSVSASGRRVGREDEDGLHVWDLRDPARSWFIRRDFQGAFQLVGDSLVAKSSLGTMRWTLPARASAQRWSIGKGIRRVKWAEPGILVSTGRGFQLVNESNSSHIEVTHPYLLGRVGDQIFAGGLTTSQLSSDGRSLVYGSLQGQLYLWDLTNPGNPSVLARNHTLNPTRGVSFSPDGSLLITSFNDGKLRLWSIKGGLLKTYDTEHEGIFHFAFLADNEGFLSASSDGIIRRWSLGGDNHILLEAGIYCTSIEVSPTGGQALARCRDAYLIDLESADARKLQGHLGDVTVAQYSTDGSMFVTAADDGIARMWDATSGEVVWVFRGHTRSIRSASFDPTDTYLLTTSDDGTARAWDLASGEPLTEYTANDGSISHALWSPDGLSILTATTEGLLRVHQLPIIRSDNEVAAELRRASRYCLPVTMRMLEFGEEEGNARARFEECEKRIGPRN